MPTIPLSQPEFDYNLDPPDWVAPNLRDREYHRMVIANLMGHGESLLLEVTKQHEIHPESIGLKVADIEANVRYLRDLYSRWFSDMSDAQKDSILEQLFSVQTPDPQEAS